MRGSCIECPDPPPPVRLAIGLVILAFNLLVTFGHPTLIGTVMDIVGDLQMFRGIGMMAVVTNQEIQAFYNQLALLTLDFSYERTPCCQLVWMVVLAFGSLLMWRIDFGRTPCGQPGCNGVVSDFVSVTLLNYMLIGITPLPFIIFLGVHMFFFGIIHEGRVVLNSQRTELGLEDVLDLRGKLPVLAKLLSRFRACFPSVRHEVACKWYRKAQAR